MFEAIAKASIVKVVALATMLSWNQPLGCHQLSGVNVGPYHFEGQDPALGTVLEDAQLELDVLVAGLAARRLRFYGCDAVLERAVWMAKSLPQSFRPQVALGAWISSDLAANEEQLECVIRLCSVGLCDMAVIGNEALLRGDVNETMLLGYVRRARAALPGVPVTTADVHSVLLEHPKVIEAVDVVLGHFYPFWSGVPIERAVPELHRWYDALQAAAGSKQVIVGETGWPSCGRPVGAAVPSEANAAFYFHNFVTWTRTREVTSFYFSIFDEPWKAQSEGEVGRCWGLFEENYEIKPWVERVFTEEFPAPVSWSE